MLTKQRRKYLQEEEEEEEEEGEDGSCLSLVLPGLASGGSTCIRQ